MPANVADGSWACENSNARRAHRNILEKLRAMRTDNAADIRLDAMLENCIFYISPMYEFSHSLGPDPEKLGVSICFPVYPRQRTFVSAVGTSVQCQKRL